MTDAQFDAFVASAVSELKAKQETLSERWGLGRFARYLFEQSTASLQFFDATGLERVRATVIPLGSYASRSRTWQWAWANESFLEPLRASAGALRNLHGVTGFPVFAAPTFNADADMAGEISAMAVKHLGALGCYRAPAATSDLYLAIMQIAEVQ
jgi:hypothetical protein